ncbi:transglycosylase domain-containing protein [Niallia sp. NCCP-28]|uniref:transglycosylase domain-containing protein n=1 Tax=Niallia sp. NCCP-28 TaxID=2934712 RepID=UPI00207D9675|nr:PBP1A family penicillin-binding protein [Niallia sp. NCCP-28]GKU84700.1 penicillin-binding protein [Niallia sp. NCCP-28]
MEKLKPYIEKVRLFWKKRHITQIILLALLVVILLSILYFTYLASQANVSTLKAGLSQATVIYDKDGDEATRIKTDRTEGVEISELPDYVPGAVVAIEDERFYQHNGFDIKGIARVFFKNILAGRITGGGSTITQQLTKNALLSSEQTYKRKAEELFLAVEIEKHYKKDEILQMYLNHVYFGSGAWGIDTASKKYFNKSIKDVSISEAALLAGLLQAPSALDPYKNYDGAMKRRNIVLSKMKEQNIITNKEYKKAVGEKIILEDGGGSFIKREYPYYTDAVIDEAISLYGLTQDELLKRGYEIYTEMDQNLQSTLEKTFDRDYLFPSSSDDALVQGGSVLLDPETGGIRGLVGGRGEHVFRGFNRATQIKAQPGSTLKPLAVYTPALEEGYKVTSKLQDKPFKKGDYEPQNFTKTYQGEVPMYEALEKSLNVPAVWLLDKIGLDKGLDSLERFGIPLDKEDEYLGVALGGMHKGVSPLQMAEAYSTFPNEGVRMESHLITKIVGPTGKVIAEYKPKSTKVTSKSVADNMTSMLLDVIKTGTGQGAQVTGFQIAGKTGSTQLPFNATGTKDQWFVGYTPNLVGAMWLGYDKTDQQHYLESKSSGDVVPIFKTIMDQAVQYVEPENFSVSSVSQQLANEEDTKQKVENTKKEIKEKAKELEGTLMENSSKWKEVINEMKKDAEKVAEKVKEIIGN